MQEKREERKRQELAARQELMARSVASSLAERSSGNL